MIPPKIVPCAFVSRGSMTTRMAGSRGAAMEGLRKSGCRIADDAFEADYTSREGK
jgi:hypothetical protein